MSRSTPERVQKSYKSNRPRLWRGPWCQKLAAKFSHMPIWQKIEFGKLNIHDRSNRPPPVMKISSRSRIRVAKRAAERRNGAQFVPKAKRARLTWGTPEWSNRAEEEYVYGDVNCSSPERSEGDD